MKIKLGKVEFEVGAVAEQLRAALLSDPVIAQGVWRDVYRWDASAKAGKILVPTSQDGGVPLGNGLNFFVPRVTANGAVVKSDTSSTTMAKRFLEAVGARQIVDVIKGLNTIINLPQKTLPLANFSPLNPAASYQMKMHVDFAVVQLRDAGRNLTAYVYVPGQVSFHHEIAAIVDQDAYDALIAATPAMAQPQPAFIVPVRSKANQSIRMIALAKRIEEMQPAIAKLTKDAPATPENEHLRRSLARAVAEWRAISPKAGAAATV